MRILLSLILALVLSGCASMNIDDFRGSKPEFDLERYFSGHTRAYGSFFDRGGNLKRQFTVEIQGYRQGEEFVLDEHFSYSDGEKQTRQWRIRAMGDGRYVGRAADVVGDAEGIARGQALNWRYQLRLPWGEGTVDVDFDDWMFLQTEDVIINRAAISKWGLRVGEVVLFFHKQADAARPLGGRSSGSTWVASSMGGGS